GPSPRQGARGLAFERRDDARLRLRRVSAPAVGRDRARPRRPRPRAERIRVDRRHAAIHRGRSLISLRRGTSATTASDLNPGLFASKKWGRKSTSKRGALTWRKRLI